MLDARSKNHAATLRDDKLYVDDIIYVPPPVPYGQQGYGTRCRTSNELINNTINKNNKDIFHDFKVLLPKGLWTYYVQTL